MKCDERHFKEDKKACQKVVILNIAALQGITLVAIVRLTDSHVVSPRRDSVYDAQTDQTAPFIAFYFELGGVWKQVRPGTRTRGGELLLAKLPNANN